jgi:hypothetical protein
MSYPYPDLQNLVQFPFTPQDYEGWIEKNHYYMYPTPPAIPTYIYARCPICAAICQQPINIYSLHFRSLELSIPHGMVLKGNGLNGRGIACSHHLGVHEFINLHGKLPHEVDYLVFDSGEVPYITPWFLPDDIESFAVLHALPIHQVLEGQFIPAYTRFMLTYFSVESATIIQRGYDSQRNAIKNDDEYYPYTLAQPYRLMSLPTDTTDVIAELPKKFRDYYEPMYDLSRWAANGKLGYLDYSSPDLPLMLGNGLTLPAYYQQIEGRKYYCLWQAGQFRPF